MYTHAHTHAVGASEVLLWLTRVCVCVMCTQEGDVVIMDVDPDGSIAVLAGDKKMRQTIDSTPAGIA